MIFPFHLKFGGRIVAFLSYTETFFVIHRPRNDLGIVYGLSVGPYAEAKDAIFITIKFSLIFDIGFSFELVSI